MWIDELFGSNYNKRREAASGAAQERMIHLELSDAKKMKQADTAAMEEREISSLALMERAASALARAAAEYRKDNHTAVIFAAPGNNGGDGIAAARLLLDMNLGLTVRVFLVGSIGKMTPDTRAMALRLVEEHNVTAENFVPGDAQTEQAVMEAGVIIDSLFGVGLNRPLAGDALKAVELINRSPAPVVSADIPSGISADTGKVLGAAVKADCTVTFSRGKPGHFAEPGCIYRGELRVEDIGIPEDILEDAGCGVYAIDGQELRLPKRPRLSHKGDFGKLLIIGGSIPYTGAPALCALGAVRAGAGLVYLGVPADIYEIEAIKNQEAMVFPLASGEKGRISRRAWDAVNERLSVCDVCVIGPGMGRGEDTEAVTRLVIRNARIPIVADADALWAISRDTSVLEEAALPVILTPHEGEFQRLLGRPVEDRLGDSLAFAAEHRCVVVLKGHRTVCAFPDGKAYIIDAGNPGMAKGGSGDVLAGVMGAMMGQLPCRRAIITACWLHARAGDLAEQRFGEYAMKAGDIIDCLPRAEMEIIR